MKLMENVKIHEIILRKKDRKEVIEKKILHLNYCLG